MSDLNYATMPVKPLKPFTMDVRKKAASAARTFDVFAVITAGVGAIVTTITFVTAMASGGDSYQDEATNGLLLMMAAAMFVATVLSWACLSLASVIAGYIAQRS